VERKHKQSNPGAVVDKIKLFVQVKYVYYLIFVTAPSLLLFVCALRGVYPFGQGSVPVLD
jgi:hypothetical protein